MGSAEMSEDRMAYLVYTLGLRDRTPNRENFVAFCRTLGVADITTSQILQKNGFGEDRRQVDW